MSRQKKLIFGGDPEGQFGVPTDKDFELTGEFMPADGCEKIALALIQNRDSLRHLSGMSISFLWKRKGAEKPRRKLGHCQLSKGLLGYFSQTDFVIVFCANNCRGITNWGMEALIFHELKHAGTNEKGEPCTIPHDCETFGEEIERYGFWKGDIKFIAEAVQKSMLLPFDPPPGHDGENSTSQRVN